MVETAQWMLMMQVKTLNPYVFVWDPGRDQDVKLLYVLYSLQVFWINVHLNLQFYMLLNSESNAHSPEAKN